MTRTKSMTLVLLLGLLVALAALGAWVGDALATPSITGQFNFRDNLGPRPVDNIAGDFLFVGATGVTPAGSGTTVQAVQGGTTMSVPFRNSTIFPNNYAAIFAFNPALTGAWTLTATDGSGPSAPVTTNTIPNPEVIPLVNNLQASGALLTPHISWTLPNLTGLGVTRISVRVRDLDVFAGGGVTDQIFTSAFLAPTATSFDIPAGVLALGKHYAFDVLLDNIVTPSSGPAFLQNRSETFTGVYATPEPSTFLLLGAGLVALSGTTQRLRRRK